MILNTLIDRDMWNNHVPSEHDICSFPIHSTTVLLFIFHVQMNKGKL